MPKPSNGALTMRDVALIVRSPFACAIRTAEAERSTRGVAPAPHVTVLMRRGGRAIR